MGASSPFAQIFCGGLALRACPAKKYEKDINSLLSKEKQKEIYELFTNYNKLHSEEKFREVESKLHLACSDGDVELIKIYLSERDTYFKLSLD